MNEYLPGLAGVPATKSNISDIDGEKGILYYRGYPIEELAKHSTFEETILLLMHGELPKQQRLNDFSEDLRTNHALKYNLVDLMKALPSSADPMLMLQTAVSSLGMFYHGSECLVDGDVCSDLDYVNSATIKIIARMGTMVTSWKHIAKGYEPAPSRYDLNYAESFLYMLTGKEPDPVLARILDVCFILHAEHTINASTFSVLVNGSTLASPYSVISSAIGCLSGPLHGGANAKVLNMLEHVGSPKNAAKFVEQQLKHKGKIWGMGHREYQVKDPRATILQGLIQELREKRGGDVNPLFEVAEALEKACEDRLAEKGVYANVDYYSGLLYREMGIPDNEFTTIFAIARSAGWLAHWREQLKYNKIFRPTQIYTGKQKRHYVNIDDR
ncbi:MAG: citrate synthase [Gammaproteobacteria bacterium]|nr:citrate synthase [Gammaproteobacteria bacterium]